MRPPRENSARARRFGRAERLQAMESMAVGVPRAAVTDQAIKPPVEPNNSGYGGTWPATYDPFGQTFFINVTARTD